MVDFLLEALNVFLAGGGALGFCAWLFKKSLLSIIDREVKKEIEDHKHELQKEQEHLKHDLRKEFIKQEFYNSSIQTIYPELIRLMRKIEKQLVVFLPSNGATTHGPTYSHFDRNDFMKLMYKNKVPKDTFMEIMNQLRDNRELGVKKLNRHLKNRSVVYVSDFIDELNDYHLLKKMFMSDEVKECFEITFTELLAAFSNLELIDFELEEYRLFYDNYVDDIESFRGLVNELETIMKSELVS